MSAIPPHCLHGTIHLISIIQARMGIAGKGAQETDGKYSYVRLYYIVLKFFEIDPVWSKDVIGWWNR